MLVDRYYETRFRDLVKRLIDGELDEWTFLDEKDKLERKCGRDRKK